MQTTNASGRLAAWRRAIHDLLDPAPNPPLVERAFNLFLSVLILVNVAVTVLDTVPELNAAYAAEFALVTRLSFVVFLLEYLARLWVAPLQPGAPRGWRAYAHQVLTPLALIDLAVLVALVLPNLGVFAALRGLRLLKLLSLLKLGRYSNALRVVGEVIRSRADELLVLILIVAVLVLISAATLYHVESALGTKCFESIPAAMWWSIVTLTTVGYGDCYPASGLGKLFSGFILMLGVGVVALPAGLIASGFADAMRRHKEEEARAEGQEKARCPHCGAEL